MVRFTPRTLYPPPKESTYITQHRLTDTNEQDRPTGLSVLSRAFKFTAAPRLKHTAPVTLPLHWYKYTRNPEHWRSIPREFYYHMVYIIQAMHFFITNQNKQTQTLRQ